MAVLHCSSPGHFPPQIMQGFGVGFLSKRFPDDLLLKFSIVLMSLSYLILVRELLVIRTNCAGPW